MISYRVRYDRYGDPDMLSEGSSALRHKQNVISDGWVIKSACEKIIQTNILVEEYATITIELWSR